MAQPETTAVNWTAISAIGTFAAVIVALFGDWLKSKIFRPRLILEITNPLGTATTMSLTKETTRYLPARYYHVRIRNTKAWPAATEVRVYLTRLEAPGPDEELVELWRGEVPLQWELQEVHPMARKVGPDANADLCAVANGKGLMLFPLILPFSLADYRTTPSAATYVLTLEARGVEHCSKPHQFRIAWDGHWADGASEMGQHLRVKQLS